MALAECPDPCLFDFEAVDIQGQNQQLNKYKGKQIHVKYKELGLRILAFPCNQFRNQEPGTEEEIIEFVKKYNVTFDMFQKIDVNGPDAHPVFKWLKEKLVGFLTNDVKWNFTKFLCNKEGVPYKRYAPKDPPNSLLPDIEDLLTVQGHGASSFYV